MPIRIRIDVNGRDERTYWIGRVEGNQQSNSINTYVIGQGLPDFEPWNYPGGFEALTHFTHRYGDGLEVCVRKGIEAWENEANVH